ncbi:hypothetical protein DPEC_G00348880 [Dallia pectoralis]|uniref:Uncharacterized protein n=1 Tax=Dallia pectoralis TaxID=75939 RepID=A0ACC2F1B5_DALPE|nr:hypothetical protein DPEC_G00348880 [Dallia pectoralis]
MRRRPVFEAAGSSNGLLGTAAGSVIHCGFSGSIITRPQPCANKHIIQQHSGEGMQPSRLSPVRLRSSVTARV